MNPDLSIPGDRVAAFCRENGIARLAVFGSALREDFGPESDIDLLVRFHETTRPTLLDLSRMEPELKVIFGREVDLVSWRGIERSANPIRRKAILETAETVDSDRCRRRLAGGVSGQHAVTGFRHPPS